MTSRPLPPDGPERAAFVTGLSLMSAHCTSPHLTPECPFYETTPQGAVCAEQCMDLLAAHRHAEHEATGQPVGVGLTAIRNPAPRLRPRRSPDADQRPFDAAGLQVRDRDRPIEQRAISSLIRDLSDHMMLPPALAQDPAERAYLLRASMAELDRRGLDADELVRCGLASRIGAGLTVTLMAKDMMAQQEHLGTIIDALPEPDPAWLACLEAARVADRLTAMPLMDYTLRGPGRRRITMWMKTAKMEDVHGLIAPSPTDFAAADGQRWTPEQLARNTWLVDRFTKTYLDDWREDSLVLEWDYLHGNQEGCCPSTIMAERKTHADEVGSLLAHSHAAGRKRQTRNDGDDRLAPEDFIFAAAEHVGAGRHETAAAIFAAVLRVSPNSPEANNNYGFCVLPTEAAEALHHLEIAAPLVPHRLRMTNAANRALALHLLGRDDEALQVAEEALGSPRDGDMSFLWRHGESPLAVTEPIPPRPHLQQLRSHIAGGTLWDTCRHP